MDSSSFKASQGWKQSLSSSKVRRFFPIPSISLFLGVLKFDLGICLLLGPAAGSFPVFLGDVDLPLFLPPGTYQTPEK
jgi:hypothetical protein